MPTISETITYHGFRMETILTQEGTNVRGWLVQVQDRNGGSIAAGVTAGPWISRIEARAEAERVVRGEIGKPGEPLPTRAPVW